MSETDKMWAEIAQVKAELAALKERRQNVQQAATDLYELHACLKADVERLQRVANKVEELA